MRNTSWREILRERERERERERGGGGINTITDKFAIEYGGKEVLAGNCL